MTRTQPDEREEMTGLRSGGRVLFSVLAVVTVEVLFLSGLLLYRHQPWTAAWWACVIGSLTGFAAVFDTVWRPDGPTVPWAVVLLGIPAVVLYWADPGAPAGPALMVLLSVVIAGYCRKKYLWTHVAVMLVGIAGAHIAGARPLFQLMLMAVMAGVIGVVRWLYLRHREQLVQNDHLRRLMELLPVLKARGVQDVVQAAVRHIVRATGSRTGIVLLLDEQSQVLRPHYLHSEASLSPEEREAIMTTTIRVGVGLSGWVAKHGQSIFTNDAMDDPRSVQVPGTPREDESILVVPLMTNGRLYGVLRVDRQGKNQYQLSDLHLLELMAAHVSDAISRAELEERLARRDALTGVYNRHYLNEWSQRVKSESREVSVLLIDCRKFKQINDRWGHLTGDWVLQQCAQIISSSVRSRDLVVRYGGDEFLVVLADTGRQEAQAIAERVLQRVEEWNRERSEDEPRLYLDIGVETAQQSEWQKLLDRADERMYACKHA
ncbi:GGDEF domain-containing protein [Symbiobacterium terraclitae]|uniref:GGDEF domain-containing protein n=1 Tax=Symbiobacterium terraclitae TaxID=557451 RepID=UPI0035B511FD